MVSRREFLASAAALPLGGAPVPLRAGSLKCEYATDPLGIDVRRPRLSWLLESKTPGARQTAWQVLAASSAESLAADRGDLWDSGKVASSSSAHNPYDGRELRSRTRCWWKVRVWDEAGAVSPWSDAARLEMGLLGTSDWRASWIGVPEPENLNAAATGPAPWFRKEFLLERAVRSARAYVCGLGFHELYLNGKKVGGHALSPNQTDYDRRRLRHLLYPFDDRTTKRVAYLTWDVTSLLVEGLNAAGLVLGNGWYNQRDRVEEGWMWYGPPRAILQLEVELKGGKAVEVATDASWRTTTGGPIVHDGIFTGERYDARLEMPGWAAPGYDDSSWLPAVLVRRPDGPLVAQYGLPDRAGPEIEPAAIERPGPGVVVFDMGRNLAGWASLTARGPHGSVLTLRYIEESNGDYGQSDSYVLKGDGPEAYEPRFTWHGFRTIELAGAPEVVASARVRARAVHTDVQSAGTFECSNPLFNRIWENYRRTQLSNMHCGVASDCPHGERLGYTGDAQVAAQSAIYAFDMARFYSNYADDMAGAQNSVTGFVPHTAPFEGGGGGPPWGSAMVLLPWYLYLYYGDRQVLERHYGAMARWVDYLGSRTDERGIVVREEPGGWFLGDWCAPDKVEISPAFVSTCYYAHCARITGRVAALLGNVDEATRFADLASRTASAIDARFFDPAGRCYEKGKQGANFYPLAFNLVPEREAATVFGRAVELIEANRRHFDTGFVGTPLVLDVLTARGRADIAYDLMNQTTHPSFGFALAQGATTLWERWDGRGSHCHPMFGGACRWFFQGLAGLQPDPEHPGFVHFFVRPSPVRGLESVRAEYQSMRGVIEIRWLRKAGRFDLHLRVPANSTATVTVAGEKAMRTVGAGDHEFTSTF